MTHVCAWCGASFAAPDLEPPIDFISHGICLACLSAMCAQLGMTLEEVMDDLPDDGVPTP